MTEGSSEYCAMCTIALSVTCVLLCVNVMTLLVDYGPYLSRCHPHNLLSFHPDLHLRFLPIVINCYNRRSHHDHSTSIFILFLVITYQVLHIILTDFNYEESAFQRAKQVQPRLHTTHTAAIFLSPLTMQLPTLACHTFSLHTCPSSPPPTLPLSLPFLSP